MKSIVFGVRSIDMGGAQRVTAVLANELTKKYDVSIFSCEKSQSYFPLNVDVAFPKQPMTRRDMIIHRVKEKIKNNFLKKKENTYPNINKIEKDFFDYIEKKKPEVLIISQQFILIVPEIKKKFPNIKIIYCTHTNIDTIFQKYYRASHEEVKSGFELCDNVVSLTNYDHEKMKKYNKGSVCIYNPLTIETFEKSRLDKKIVSFVGRIDFQHKGIDLLIEIGSKLPDGWKLRIAGSGNFVSMIKLKRLIKKYDCEEKIIYAGQLKDKQLTEHYKNSSAFISTSRWEGFGLVLTEAMKVGLPIISFNHTGGVEILENGKYGVLIENGDVSKFSEVLNSILLDPEKLKELQLLSLERVEDFDLSKIIAEWEEIIEN